MKLTEKLKSGPILSVEILPPERGENLDEIFRLIDSLLNYPLDFISVTRHPPEVPESELSSLHHSCGKAKILPAMIKRPGTIGITAALMKRYPIEVIPHLLCYGMSKYEIENTLIDLDLMGVRNIFVIRGEPRGLITTKITSEYKYASDLVQQISNLNRGKYLFPCAQARPTDFCIGVAAYPEKHYQSPNLREDLKNLKVKVQAGADFIFTQMVFDFVIYKSFVEKARESGINLPIIPGIKPVISKKTLYQLPGKFFITIPEEFTQKMEEARTPEQEFIIGTKFMAALVEKILSENSPGIHIFTMGKGRATMALLEAIFGGRRRGNWKSSSSSQYEG